MLYKTWRPKGFYQFEIIMNVLISFFYSLRQVVVVVVHSLRKLGDRQKTLGSRFYDNNLLKYLRFASISIKNIYFSHSAGIDFIRQNLTSAVTSKVKIIIRQIIQLDAIHNFK